MPFQRGQDILMCQIGAIEGEPHGRMVALGDVLGTFGGQAPRYEKEPRRLKIARDDIDIKPGLPVLLRIPFPPGTDGDSAIEAIERWE
jgi:hypothetical protein